jgi:hypothetical protein
MRSRILFALIAPALATLASAQADFDFVVNQAQSNFTWSGSSTLGPIVGNPSNAFQWAGDTHMTLSPSGAVSFASGDFPGAGDAHTVPDLHGKVPNPIPIFPPLATIDVTNLHIRLSAPTFAIAANGSFTASLTLTALSGTLAIHPAIGTPSTTDLTGQQSTPALNGGTLTAVGNNAHLSFPVNSTFQFSDPVSGASGTINVIGTLNADWTCPAASTYCTAKTNSVGCVPAIATSGAASYTSASAFTISATNIVNQKSGLLFYGFAAAATPFQGGFMCVAAPTKRTAIQNSAGTPSGNDCTGTYAYNFNTLIQSLSDAQLVPGAQVFTEYWSRDPASASTTNLTNAAQFTIAP